MKSMTGFASVSRENESATIGLTIRTLNHRFLDLQLRLPSSLGDLEPRIRALVQRHLARGRVEISVSLQVRQDGSVEADLNEAFADAVGAAVELARARGLVSGPLTPGDLLRFPQALTIRDRAWDRDPELVAALSDAVAGVANEALAALDVMRSTEGGHLQADLERRRRLLADLVERIAEAAEKGRAALEARLTDRVRELTTDLGADKVAVAQEIVRFAGRSDISEEISRFRGHLSHWAALAEASEPCGRKLDFLLQEMNREVNTMGSKADGLAVSELIILAKAELEKMREQIQNVE